MSADLLKCGAVCTVCLANTSSLLQFPVQQIWLTESENWAGMVQVYEVNRKLLQEHAAPLMAVYLHGVAVVRQELNMDVGGKTIKGTTNLLCIVTLKICLPYIAAVV